MAHRLPLKDIKFIADFAAYARSRGDEAYDYMNPSECAIAQFAETGASIPESVALHVSGAVYDLAMGTPVEEALVSCDDFAALADRLEALLVDAPKVSA